MSQPLAIIDIGSNSIKLLVGTATKHLFTELIGIRLKSQSTKLTQESIDEAIKAISLLIKKAAQYAPLETLLVATSAVREASNKKLFCQQVLSATGHKVNVLTGEEEAKFIAEGVASDQKLQGLQDFYLFDLGGGSLELIHIKNQRVIELCSLPLGAVRLTEIFIKDKTEPISEEVLLKVSDHISSCIQKSNFDLTQSIPLVGMGGGLSTAIKVLGISPILKTKQIKNFLSIISAKTLEERLADKNIPRFRADVLPAALITVLTVARICNAQKLIYSPYNLRFGLLNLWAKGQLKL